jgi:hypothetical protein
MQRRRSSFSRCCCAVLLCCAVLCCCAFQHPPPPHAVLLATDLSLSVVVRVLREGSRVMWVCWCWLSCCRGALVLSPGIRSLVCWGSQGRSFPAVRSGLLGVDVAEHLVPSCSIHHDVLPCRSWDLAEEEVDFSRRSLSPRRGQLRRCGCCLLSL